MNRQALAFDRPADLVAREPPEVGGSGRDDVRLLVDAPDGRRDAHFTDLPAHLRDGDLIVVNESATLPASLVAKGRLGEFLLNLSTRFAPDLWAAEPRWGVGVQGPLPLSPGEDVRAAGASLRMLAPYPGIPRLWFVQTPRDMESRLHRHGRAIQYGHAPAPLPLDAFQTGFARVPGSAEMPSAARPFSPRMREALRRAGVAIASVVLHTGVSSLEIETDEVEGHAMYPEPFEVPRETADAANGTRARGGRIIAVGTSVVRALETAWTPAGLRPARGFTRVYVHPGRGVHAIDGLLTGFHDPVTSHLAMLVAVAGLDRVRDAYAEAVRRGYRWHEFGDSHLIVRGDLPRAAAA